MAVAQWKLARLEVGERSIFAQTMPAEKQMALLDRFSTQRSRLERSFSKAARDLEHFQKTRPARQLPLKQPVQIVAPEEYPTTLIPSLLPPIAACPQDPLGT